MPFVETRQHGKCNEVGASRRRSNNKLIQGALHHAVILDEKVIVVVRALLQKLVMGVIWVPPQHSADRSAHRQTRGLKIGACETDHILERYWTSRPSGLIERDIEVHISAGFGEAPCLTFHKLIPRVGLEDNRTIGDSFGHILTWRSFRCGWGSESWTIVANRRTLPGLLTTSYTGRTAGSLRGVV